MRCEALPLRQTQGMSAHSRPGASMPSSRPVFRLVAAAALACMFAAGTAGAAPPAVSTGAAQAVKEQAIFAVSDADPQKWNLTLGNIANAIEGIGADGADIELVVYGPGIAMLKKDSPVAERIAAALKSGVHVNACQNSMRGA